MTREIRGTDRQLVREVFAKLRKEGYFARMNFQCCQSCGWYEVPSEKQDARKVVFFHQQSGDSFDVEEMLARELHLYWALDEEGLVRVCELLEEAGLVVRRPKNNHESIGVRSQLEREV